MVTAPWTCLCVVVVPAVPVSPCPGPHTHPAVFRTQPQSPDQPTNNTECDCSSSIILTTSITPLDQHSLNMLTNLCCRCRYRYQVCGMYWVKVVLSEDSLIIFTSSTCTPPSDVVRHEVIASWRHLGPVCCGGIVFEGDPATSCN